MNNKLVSINIKSDFGFLKKPDTNDPMYFTFNMLHKPALLGIMGAIIGAKGFQKHGELPEYYKILKNIKVAIAPLEEEGKSFHENGNFAKTVIKYNNTTGLASEEEGGNLIITEQALVAPAYKCWFMLDLEKEMEAKLYDYLKANWAEYLPYLGKNEFSLWWDHFTEYEFELFVSQGTFKIDSTFIKESPIKDGKSNTYFRPGVISVTGSKYLYFERLPIGYIEEPLFQYEYKDFSFTNWELKQDYSLPENLLLYKLST
ncbi:MAG: type I-B CRISPR-associated protein Cas5, partial [Bacteroidales bacterium]|nr:type I-B CRISPR-associated protein Cas5 [Bacteroidales bacterium]